MIIMNKLIIINDSLLTFGNYFQIIMNIMWVIVVNNDFFSFKWSNQQTSPNRGDKGGNRGYNPG